MSDFLESARSSGVIGISLIIFLLIGFGALFLAVFDDRLNGENASKLKGLVNEQGAELYGLEGEIEWAEAALVAQKRNAAVYEELERTNKVLEVLTQKESALTAQIDEEKQALKEVEEEQLSYREEYRTFARESAIGESFDELVLASGKVLKNVKIKEILVDKVRFTTEFGTTSVEWDDISDELKERFQIGEGELEAHHAKLAAIQEKRNQLAAEGRNERGVLLREAELRKSLRRIEKEVEELTKSRDRSDNQARAFRAKASEFRSKASSSNFNRKTNTDIALKFQTDAKTCDRKVASANEKIRNLEQERKKLERELQLVERDR